MRAKPGLLKHTFAKSAFYIYLDVGCPVYTVLTRLGDELPSLLTDTKV